MTNLSLPSVEQFKEILLANSFETVVEQYLFSGPVYAFRDRPQQMDTLRKHLAERLELSTQDVRVIGSGKLGFSLSPNAFARQFSDESDLDVLIVNSRLFDMVWRTLLGWNYPRRYRLDGIDLKWGRLRMQDVYWGWFRPDRIRFDGISFPHALKPVRDISTAWFNAFQSLSHYQEFASRSISGRLYRTWDHALMYHVDSLRLIKDILITSQ